MNYIGIDPGASGAIIVLSAAGKFIASETFKKTDKFSKDLMGLRILISDYAGAKVVLENVHAMTGQGTKSTFTFGRMTGLIEGMLIQAGVPYELVLPQLWQKDLGLLGIVDKILFKTSAQKKHARKQAYVRFAKTLFPEHLVTPDTADAFLIAEWGRRKYEGGYDV